jgi:hypothetical protein
MRNYWLPVIKVEEHEYQHHIWWYISKSRDNQKVLYLHKDGIWRGTTLNEKNEYTGYFPSKQAAEELLNSI